ncbi:MAG: hypothetical protein HQL90_05910 [Magnetococcales bacterium]|nr:hypothetical protein [Magnetococcales bacterium]
MMQLGGQGGMAGVAQFVQSWDKPFLKESVEFLRLQSVPGAPMEFRRQDRGVLQIIKGGDGLLFCLLEIHPAQKYQAGQGHRHLGWIQRRPANLV